MYSLATASGSDEQTLWLRADPHRSHNSCLYGAEWRSAETGPSCEPLAVVEDLQGRRTPRAAAPPRCPMSRERACFLHDRLRDGRLGIYI